MAKGIFILSLQKNKQGIAYLKHNSSVSFGDFSGVSNMVITVSDFLLASQEKDLVLSDASTRQKIGSTVTATSDSNSR